MMIQPGVKLLQFLHVQQSVLFIITHEIQAFFSVIIFFSDDTAFFSKSGLRYQHNCYLLFQNRSGWSP